MKTHFAYVYKKLLQTYHNTGFFWLQSKQIIWRGGLSSVVFSANYVRNLRQPFHKGLFISRVCLRLKQQVCQVYGVPSRTKKCN